MERNREKKRAIFFMLASSLGFALMNLFVRLSGPLPTDQKSFFRNLIAFIFVAITYLFASKRQQAGAEHDRSFRELGRRDIVLLCLRSVFGLLGVLANFYALDHMPVANASVFNKTAPFFTLLFSFILLKERVKLYQIFAMIMAFIGVLVISNLGSAELFSVEFLPVLIALAGGFFAGLAYTTVRKLGQLKIQGQVIILFFSGFSTLVLGVKMLFSFQAMSLSSFFFLVLAGLAAALGQFGVTFAYRYAPAREVSIYDYSTIVFTALLSFVFLAEHPTLRASVGAILIFLAALYMFWRQSHEEAIAEVHSK
ncbi:MAG: DMT family transporter [Eubacteriales bacterium]|nr:DMT family transporter [Eubacteriales bacterium]